MLGLIKISSSPKRQMWQRSKCSSSKNWNSRTQRSRNNRKLFRAMTLRKKMKHQQKNHRNKCRTVSNLSQGSVRGLSPFTAASSSHTSFLTDQLGPKEAKFNSKSLLNRSNLASSAAITPQQPALYFDTRSRRWKTNLPLLADKYPKSLYHLSLL